MKINNSHSKKLNEPQVEKRKVTPRYIIIELLKTSNKEKPVKAARVKRHIM